MRSCSTRRFCQMSHMTTGLSQTHEIKSVHYMMNELYQHGITNLPLLYLLVSSWCYDGMTIIKPGQLTKGVMDARTFHDFSFSMFSSIRWELFLMVDVSPMLIIPISFALLMVTSTGKCICILNQARVN